LFFENHGYIYIYISEMDDGALVSASDMSKYGASWADVYSLPGNRYMAKAGR
jgi:hypothetical protein